jgi:hypothetical protein
VRSASRVFDAKRHKTCLGLGHRGLVVERALLSAETRAFARLRRAPLLDETLSPVLWPATWCVPCLERSARRTQIIDEYGRMDRKWVPDIVGRAWGNRGSLLHLLLHVLTLYALACSLSKHSMYRLRASVHLQTAQEALKRLVPLQEMPGQGRACWRLHLPTTMRPPASAHGLLTLY